MKTFISIITVAFLWISCASVQPKIADANQISAQNKLEALAFAKKQFESCTTGKYQTLTTKNSTPHLVKSLTITEMKKACEKINKDCGQLQELELQEILTDQTGFIFRYKATYSATTRKPEIRVYTNFNHKFDGIIYKPQWLDQYTPFNP